MAQHVRLDLLSASAFAVLAALAFAVARRRPVYGIALLVMLDPFDLARYAGWTTVTVPKVALIGVACGLFARRTPLGPLLRPQIRAPLGGGVAIALVTIATIIPGTYVDAVGRESLKALEYLATFALALVAIADDPAAMPLWSALAAVTATVCASALAQEWFGAPAAVMLAGHTIPRIAGLLEGPNQLAGFFDIALPLLLARGVRAGGAPYLGVAALAFVTDVLTFSRAGLLAAAFGILVVTIGTTDPIVRRRIATVAGPIAILTVVALNQLHLFARFLSTADVDTASGLGSRAELWSAALGFFRSHPVLGIGAGNFELELPQAGLTGVRTHANSLYLQTLAEGGVLLFGATLFTIGSAIRMLARAPKEPLFVGTCAATAALALHQVLDDLTFFPKIGGFWWLWLGIAAGALVARTAVRA